jgi:hypothetical protein
MAEVNERKEQDERERENERGLVQARSDRTGLLPVPQDGQPVVTPYGIPQSTFNERMRAGIPGMVNRMVLYNAISRNCSTVAGIPYCRAVSQGADPIDAVIGGTLAAFLGITILDPTIVHFTPGMAPETYAQTMEMGILTQGEMFATSAVAIAAGDPVHFGAADGLLTNTGGIGPIPGARWVYASAPGALNAIVLGIMR